MSNKPMDKIVIPAGEVITYGGVPLQLQFDTPVLGRKGNFRMADPNYPETRPLYESEGC